LSQQPQSLPPAERAAYAAVDEALRTQPLQPAPPALGGLVMAQLSGPGRAAAARPVFRLGWIDYALPAFAGLMAALALVLVRRVTPEFAARLGAQLAGPAALANGLVWLLALGGLLLAGGMEAVAVVVFRPRSAGLRRM
jgi:hypothetical protein